MFRELLAREFAPYRRLSDDQLATLEWHYRLLEKWNARMNLTRIQSLGDSVRFHYCESLFLGMRLPEGELRIADVGSGAGFPGIPVAVLRPECLVMLIESHQRKAVFLREASREIPNVSVSSARAGDVSAGFDWVVSRAVSAREALSFRGAGNAALLLSGADALGLAATEVERVPWGNDRVVAKFHVEH